MDICRPEMFAIDTGKSTANRPTKSSETAETNASVDTLATYSKKPEEPE